MQQHIRVFINVLHYTGIAIKLLMQRGLYIRVPGAVWWCRQIHSMVYPQCDVSNATILYDGPVVCISIDVGLQLCPLCFDINKRRGESLCCNRGMLDYALHIHAVSFPPLNHVPQTLRRSPGRGRMGRSAPSSHPCLPCRFTRIGVCHGRSNDHTDQWI